MNFPVNSAVEFSQKILVSDIGIKNGDVVTYYFPILSDPFEGERLSCRWPLHVRIKSRHAPYTRCLSIDSHVCCTLPSDPASRRQPLRSR
jgi:hypothetical protein